jgi:hypothetical protein
LGILLDLDKPNPTYTLTKDRIEEAIGFFSLIEPNIPKLFIASGRNELAVPLNKIVESLVSAGGFIMKKRLVSEVIDRELSPMEQTIVLRHLRDNDRIVEATIKLPNGKDTVLVMTKQWYDENVENGKVKGNGV